MDKVNVVLVGYGRWGKNWARVLRESPQANLVEVIDPQRQDDIPPDEFYGDSEWRPADKVAEAYVISSPPSTHVSIAYNLLYAGQHVLVEKPLALSMEGAMSLLRLQNDNQPVLMVGHTYLYNPAVRRMKELMGQDEFGPLYYLHATRTNMGPIRDDISAHWDLGVHDIAIFNYLTGALPESVSAVGAKPLSLGRDLYDAVWATLIYPGGVVAHLHVSWLEPQKVRQVVAVGANQRIVFDDMDLQEPLRVYNRGVRRLLPESTNFGDFHFAFRDGDIVSPKVDMYEPLKAEAEHFLHCVRTGEKPLTDGESGLQTIRVLEAMDKSLQEGGKAVGV